MYEGICNVLCLYSIARIDIRCAFISEVDYALANLDRRMVIGPYEQYGRELDVPAKRTKVKFIVCLLRLVLRTFIHYVSIFIHSYMCSW